MKQRPEAERKLTTMADESESKKGMESLNNFERALGHVRNRYVHYSESLCIPLYPAVVISYFSFKNPRLVHLDRLCFCSYTTPACTSVQPLTQMSRDEVGACISPADRAKLNLQVAYGVTSLFYMFLRTQGVSPATHPVKAELDRIR